MKILIFINYYLPGYKSGGPVRTIANLVDNLGEEFDFYIFTADRDLGEKTPYPNIKVDEWQKVRSANVFYVSPEALKSKKMRKILNETNFDILYLNSFFNFRFSIFPLFIKKFINKSKKTVVLAPRGEFSKGALALKPLKKRIFIFLSKMIGLHKNIRWHFSSESERNDAVIIMGQDIIKESVVALNMSSKTGKELTENKCIKREKGDPLRIIFLSRISPKKNLDYALEILNKVEAEICFDIYGSISEKSYWEECRKLISELPKNIKAEYKGPVENKKVVSIFEQYNLFFLPTRGENFGHVIAESLLSGTPVLISDQTPWKNLEKEGIGWELPLNQEKNFIEKIERMYNIHFDEYFEMRKAARTYARKKFYDNSIIEANRKVFEKRAGA